jgi:hypothetical protein
VVESERPFSDREPEVAFKAAVVGFEAAFGVAPEGLDTVV